MGFGFHSLAGYADSSIWAWGYNQQGQLGDNTKTYQSSPIAVAGGRSFDAIAAGDYNSLTLDISDGLIYAWGYNDRGQLGDNTILPKSSPVAVAGSRSFEFLNEMPPPPPPTPASTNLVCRLSVYFIPNSTNLVCRITNPASFPTIWGENNPTGGEINAGNWYKWSDGSGEKPDVT